MVGGFDPETAEEFPEHLISGFADEGQIPAGRTTDEYNKAYGRDKDLARFRAMEAAGIDPTRESSPSSGIGFFGRIRNFFAGLFSSSRSENEGLADNQEVMQGVTVGELKNAGFSNEKISSIQTAIAKKKNNNPNLARHIGRYAEYNLTFTPEELGLSDREGQQLIGLISNNQGRV